MLRKTKKTVLYALSLLTLASFSVHAQHIIVAPHCLLKNLAPTVQIKMLGTIPSISLIEVEKDGVDALIEAKHKRTTKPCGGFVDVTQDWEEDKTKQPKTFLINFVAPKPSKQKFNIQYTDQVNSLLKQLNPQAMWSDLSNFTNTSKGQFPDRYANSSTGVKAAAWLKEKIDTLAKEHNRSDIKSFTVATGRSYSQPSVVIKIGDSNEPGIVIGGHMDTLSSSWESKPGADDDGSGSMTVMGIARTIIESGMHFKKPIYIIWYSAEEEGLVGSGYVVKYFKNKKIPVANVIHFDMTGYAHKNDLKMWLINDNVNTDLTTFLKKLIVTYVKQPVGITSCGYECSDHASWNRAGYTAAFPTESAFETINQAIHSSRDTMDLLSLEHMTNFAKLGLAFAVELAEPTA